MVILDEANAYIKIANHIFSRIFYFLYTLDHSEAYFVHNRPTVRQIFVTHGRTHTHTDGHKKAGERPGPLSRYPG